MFNISLPEIVVIFAIALIFLGPEQLPDVARAISKFIKEIKKATNEIRGAIHREADTLKEIKEEAKNLIPDLSVSNTEKPKDDRNKQS